MSGENVLLVAKEDGHSAQTMLSTYAAWTEGATEADIETIRKAKEQSPASPQALLGLSDLPPEGGWLLPLHNR